MNTTHTRTRIVGHLFALAGTLGLALTAYAGESPAQKNSDVTVQYADLNLASTAGAKALYARLSTAAERACGYAPKSPALERHLQFKSCYESTLNRSVESVGSQQVRALHAAQKDATVG